MTDALDRERFGDHAGLPVAAGEKWLARKALRERAVFDAG